MKLVQTLVVRDEADIVEAQIDVSSERRRRLRARVRPRIEGRNDEIASYDREGVLRLFPARGRCGERRTGWPASPRPSTAADWVINTDADEFWMPRRGTLKEALAAVREPRELCARSLDISSRDPTMEVLRGANDLRLSPSAPINDPTSPYRPHRRPRTALIRNTSCSSELTRRSPSAGRALRGWYPADVLHFPFRTREQYERKGVRRAHGDKPLGQYRGKLEASERDRVEDFFGSLTVDDETLTAGRRTGSLAVDTRLRDALRDSAAGPKSKGSSADEARAAAEGVALTEANIASGPAGASTCWPTAFVPSKNGLGAMKVVLTTVFGAGDADIAEVQARFHLTPASMWCLLRSKTTEPARRCARSVTGCGWNEAELPTPSCGQGLPGRAPRSTKRTGCQLRSA